MRTPRWRGLAAAIAVAAVLLIVAVLAATSGVWTSVPAPSPTVTAQPTGSATLAVSTVPLTLSPTPAAASPSRSPIQFPTSAQLSAPSKDAIQSEKMLGIDGPDGEARRILRRCCAMRGLHERWSDAEARVRLDARYQVLAGS